MMRSCWMGAGVVCLISSLACGQDVWREDHVVVSYSGVDEAYVEAMARTVAAARQTAIKRFAFNMPETIQLSVNVDAKGRTRLYTDGKDRLFLTLRSADKLRPPKVSGVFNLYGMCHEVGHIAMYRLIRKRPWMSGAAAEGWAHYFGSRTVDVVFAAEGNKLWPEAYDYRADGMKRLTRQLRARKIDKVTKAAGLWMQLVRIVSDKGVKPIFVAWDKADIDRTDPGVALRQALLIAQPKHRKKLTRWWNRAEPVLVQKRPKSEFAVRTIKRSQLSNRPEELAHDDGRMANKRSMASNGHAVRFEAAGPDWYLRAVKIHGSRYGPPTAKESFNIWLCDEQFNVIAEFAFPYSRFRPGGLTWVTLNVTPTNVPPTFIVCVGFNPTAKKGVFVSHDAEASGSSLTGLPGRQGGPLRQGDWLIRAVIDQPETADALTAQP